MRRRPVHDFIPSSTAATRRRGKSHCFTVNPAGSINFWMTDGEGPSLGAADYLLPHGAARVISLGIALSTSYGALAMTSSSGPTPTLPSDPNPTPPSDPSGPRPDSPRSARGLPPGCSRSPIQSPTRSTARHFIFRKYYFCPVLRPDPANQSTAQSFLENDTAHRVALNPSAGLLRGDPWLASRVRLADGSGWRRARFSGRLTLPM